MYLISRVCPNPCKEAYSKLWYPLVEQNMSAFIIADKAKLFKYVLYAKHRPSEKNTDRLLDLLADEQFEEIKICSAQFFKS
jgi:hypothetical protein